MLAPISQLLPILVDGIRRQLDQRGWNRPQLIGIHRGGAWLAQALAPLLEIDSPIGTLDISFHRDDFASHGLQPQVRPSSLPQGIEDAQIVLVDDILYTGRTIRAAINELFDYGRPQGIVLAVLVSRDGRQLPIQADVAALKVQLPPGQQIKLRHDPEQSPTLWLEQLERAA